MRTALFRPYLVTLAGYVITYFTDPNSTELGLILHEATSCFLAGCAYLSSTKHELTFDYL